MLNILILLTSVLDKMISVNSLNYNIGARMLGGWQANINQYPHAILMIRSSKYAQCGGTIINESWILTAAHCLNHIIEKNSITIAFGKNYFLLNQTNTNLRNISFFIKHENWSKNDTGLYNDIALIKLSEKIEFSEIAKPMRLIKKDEAIESNYSIVTGFQKTENGSKILLMANNIQIVEDNNNSKEVSFDKAKQICGRWKINETVCYGDSGSGLFSLHENGERFLIGLISFAFFQGFNCGGKLIDVYFTRISYYLDWISEKMKNK